MRSRLSCCVDSSASTANQSESKMSFTPPAGMDKACIPGDVDNGEKLFKARCTQCHTINKVPEISQLLTLPRTSIFKPSTPLHLPTLELLSIFGIIQFFRD